MNATGTARSGESRFRVLRFDELHVDICSWIVEEVLPDQGLGVFYGAPDSGKTFVALDIAFHVAAGIPWCGRAVEQGPIVYIAAEGSRGIALRAEAWSQEHAAVANVVRERSWLVPQPVHLESFNDIDALLAQLEPMEVKPRLFVVDTVARCMLGLDENSSKDMGRVVAACDHIRERAAATVLLVHHSARSGKEERGSNALRGAVDTSIQVQRSGTVVTLACRKQKDLARFQDIKLRLDVVALEAGNGKEGSTSCVLRPLSAPKKPSDPPASVAKAARALAGYGKSGAATADWMTTSGLARTTFYDARRVLTERGYVAPVRGSEERDRLVSWPPGVGPESPESPDSPESPESPKSAPAESGAAASPESGAPTPPLRGGGPGPDLDSDGGSGNGRKGAGSGSRRPSGG